MRPHDPTVSARHSGEIKYMNGHESQNTSSSNLTPAGPESISRILDGTIYTRTLLPFFENGGYILLRVRSGEGTLISGGREYRRMQGVDLASYRFSTLFVDPPRMGLDDATVDMARRFQNILYISCNPSTLHANVAALQATHEIRAAAVFDQFPYTSHLECGLLLSRRQAA